MSAGGRAYALPLAAVGECMRPLRVQALAGAPSHVLGLGVIRGETMPVVDLARLLTGEPAQTLGRFVTARTPAGPVALAVEAVLGLSQVEWRAAATLESVGAVGGLAVLAGEPLVLLAPGHLRPEWPLALPHEGAR